MKLKGKKIEIKKKTKPLIKKGREGTTITYSLPEINIYPNNRFGDIARSQGLETARNWRKVKEGTTAGINKFGKSINTGVELISSFLPVVSDVQDAKDFYDSYKNKDYVGMGLATAGFIPFIGGFASNTNKLRRIRRNYRDLLTLAQEPDVQATMRLLYKDKNSLKKIAKSDKSTNEFFKETLQGRYNFYRGDANLTNHNINQLAPPNTAPVENGIGSGRHNAEDLVSKGKGVLYTTNDLQKAVQFGTLYKKGIGRVLSNKGGVGIIRAKQAQFNGNNRVDWINQNPIPKKIKEEDSFTVHQLDNYPIRRVNTGDGYHTYIFYGEPQRPVGTFKMLPKETLLDIIKKPFKPSPTFNVARWKKGGKNE